MQEISKMINLKKNNIMISYNSNNKRILLERNSNQIELKISILEGILWLVYMRIHQNK